ncbi:MAG: PD-(D/E)XK nuclease family protein, partial [Clostridia bacterium]|nr:PD-(D/E)XK nuclease family protein [Clostridia bacterium]
FFLSDTGERLRRAEEVHREWAFNVSLRANEALSPKEAGRYGSEPLLVQGTVDCCFLEGGEWVLLDYKTDRADDLDALAAHYRNQLAVYALALERITGRSVKQRLLCLLGAGREIEV